MARGKVILSLKSHSTTKSSLANFSRVAEAEVAVEVVAVVVVAAAGVRTVITVTAPTSPKNTRKWSTTTMSSLHCRKKRRRLSGMRSAGSCPTASDSAAPKGRVPLRRNHLELRRLTATLQARDHRQATPRKTIHPRDRQDDQLRWHARRGSPACALVPR